MLEHESVVGRRLLERDYVFREKMIEKFRL